MFDSTSREQRKQIDQEIRDVILEADNAWEAYENERDPQQKTNLKEIWKQLLRDEDLLIDEKTLLSIMLPYYGMFTIGETIDAWDLQPDTAQRLKDWLTSPAQGSKLDAPPDQAFFTMTNDDLKAAGIIALRERKKILRNLKPQAGAQMSMRVRDEALTTFWRDLCSATTDEAIKIMELPAMPAELASFMPNLKGLYVRDCYLQLTDWVVGGTHKDTLVTGTHGTGKAAWQLQLLQRLAHLRRTVVLDWANAHDRLLFCPEGAFVSTKADTFQEELLSRSNFYLRFVKEGADEKLMPPWTLQELEAALPLFPSVLRARLHELYNMWGGTVRWTLAAPNKDVFEWHLDWAILTYDMQTLQRAMGLEVDKEANGSFLVHPIPDKDLRLSHWAMASRHMSDQVCKTLQQMDHENLRNFLASSLGEERRIVLRGNLLDSYTELMQMPGGRFTVRYLDSGEEEEVELPSGPSHWFSDPCDVANQPGHVHCRPLSQMYQSIYFIRQPDEVALMSKDSEKDLFESTCIEECFKVLRAATEEPPGHVYLTCIVPPAMYPRVKRIPLTRPLHSNNYPVRHRVLRMPLMRAGVVAAMYPRVKRIPLTSPVHSNNKHHVRHCVVRMPLMRAGVLAFKPIAL